MIANNSTAVSYSQPGNKPLTMEGSQKLVDRFGRLHNSLRISVIDRCNLRCTYCMPDGPLEFLTSDRLLSFEDITYLVGLLARLGITKIRLTGGEPLLRARLPDLVERLSGIMDIEDLALTTNGMLLDRYARSLRQAGLRRINISLDTLSEETFRKLTRRSGLDRVLAGIDAAIAAGFDQIRLNALAIRGMSEQEIVPLTEFAIARGLQLRFIEYMPLDADHQWDEKQVLSGGEVLRTLESRFGRLVPVDRSEKSQPAEDFLFVDSGQLVGVIRPVTQPFCNDCNRLRLTAEGSLRNCLFSIEDWDLRQHINQRDDTKLIDLIRGCVSAKLPGHLISQSAFEQPQRAMYQIGG